MYYMHYISNGLNRCDHLSHDLVDFLHPNSLFIFHNAITRSIKLALIKCCIKNAAFRYIRYKSITTRYIASNADLSKDVMRCNGCNYEHLFPLHLH